jgi:Flp pilus assembly protein TadG
MTMVRRFLSCCKGAAAAEMALITPLALLLLFTAFEAGHYMYARHQVVKGLRDGARFAARQDFADVNCTSGPYINSSVVGAVKNMTRTGKIGGGTARVSGWANDDITVTVTCPTHAQAETGIFSSDNPAPQVNVSTSFNYDSLFNGLGVVTDSALLGGTQQATAMGI